MNINKIDNIVVCNRCVMDSTDPNIVFDESGNCNYCNDYLEKDFKYTEDKELQLKKVIDEIKAAGANKKYDCIIGVSGGVDSTYVAYEVKKRGLRPLAVHLDNGWNSELAVSNIQKTLQKLDIDLFTYVIDWQEFKDLQFSFLKASIPGMEVPTDHGIISILNKIAAKNNVKYIINGSNSSSEHIMSPRWSEGVAQRDWLLIKNVHRQFGKAKLKSFPHTSIYDFFYYKLIKKISVINILNYVDFSKEKGMKLIQDDLGWIYYGGKHYESIYTRFTQAYIQPKKFNIDKRKAHHSNLICAGEMSREEAIEDLLKDAYKDLQMRDDDKEYFMKKIGMTEDEFDNMMNAPLKSYLDYKGYFNNKFYIWLNDFAFNVHNKLKNLNYYGTRAD
ncbi:LPS biosynthesis protein WbpG [Flavobacterium collinsii]|jgi:N-acetyl sugar amidotransferase|uniref:N-acetyl sugar amidotransferase n=1 Tax=Flavobacterium collinsii TaxID=1114861 RepID=UPI0022C86031|nr:N-acetyl sugar amidotransferase [Flavobacterium collinsii]GIQ58592.1 LPS biosynthesis protein WbpG [Flavobacterium collinsii]